MAHRVFLVCLICSAFCHAAGQPPIYALKGGEVTLKPDTDGDAVAILWKHNGNKVVEFYGKQQDVYGTYGKRVTLDWSTAVLSITDLRFEDSGEYIVDVDNKKGLHRSAYKLEVIEKVASPNISCVMSDGGSSTNVSAQLLCSAVYRPPMKFEWRTHGNLQPGQQLQISLGAEHDDEVYTCNVSNPLSSETATFTAKDCYPAGSGKIADIVVHVLVVGVVGFVGALIVIIVVLTVFFKRRCKVRPHTGQSSPTKPLQGPLQPGDWVVSKDCRRHHWREPHWTGPFLILLVTNSAVKIAERATWVHASHCRKEPPLKAEIRTGGTDPQPYEDEKKKTQQKTTGATAVMLTDNNGSVHFCGPTFVLRRA